jgi:hypothetical protein
MKYKFKFSGLQYTDNLNQKHSESTVYSIVDTAYTSVKTFVSEVYNELGSSFESEYKQRQWQAYTGAITTPNGQNVSKAIHELSKNLEMLVTNIYIQESKNQSMKITTDIVDNEIHITLDSPVLTDQLLDKLKNQLKSKMFDCTTMVFINIIDNVLDIDFYLGQAAKKANFSYENNAMFEDLRKKYDIFKISKVFGSGYFLINESKLEIEKL